MKTKAILFFVADILLSSIFNKYLISTLFSFLILTAISSTKTNNKIVTILILLSWEAFLNYGRFALNLPFLILLLILIFKTNKILANECFAATIYATIYLLTQIIIIEKLILGFDYNFLNSFLYLIINLIILNLMMRLFSRNLRPVFG